MVPGSGEFQPGTGDGRRPKKSSSREPPLSREARVAASIDDRTVCASPAPPRPVDSFHVIHRPAAPAAGETGEMQFRVRKYCTTINIELSILKWSQRSIRAWTDDRSFDHTPVRDRLKPIHVRGRRRFRSSEAYFDLACSGNGEDGTPMQTVQGTSSNKNVTTHAMFLA